LIVSNLPSICRLGAGDGDKSAFRWQVRSWDVNQANQENSMAILAKGKIFAAAALVAVLALGTGAHAASCGNNGAGFDAWKQEFAAEARAEGVGSRGLAALAGASYATKTISVDRGIHKAFSGSVDAFMKRRGGAAIISKGRSLKKSNAALFSKIESTYGVSPGVLLAIWGMETGFGSSMGNQNTVSAILTLAYDCRRPQFFYPHAIAALKLVDRGALSPSSVGAAHGEIGHTQFLPGNVLQYGVGSGNLRDKNTALASTANFLKAHGWQRGASAQSNIGAIAGWNDANVYQQAIVRIATAIDGY
jgi:membrane-bound lytic murein transglycosylase B